MPAALDALEAASAKGYRNALVMLGDPVFRQLAGAPRFAALAQDMAREWIARSETLPRSGPDVLADRLQHELLLGDAAGARATLVRLGASPEPIDPALLRRLRADVERAFPAEPARP